jgi:hypothetical protein
VTGVSTLTVVATSANANLNAAFVNGNTTAVAFATLLSGIEAGLAYVNVHTVNNPNGDISGYLGKITITIR